ncbi:hypothetical protein SUGI_0002280 [Cryptomeria japonica]|nr:hypothetical protein SUGI_0002280 [Cryptomeria japonica]
MYDERLRGAGPLIHLDDKINAISTTKSGGSSNSSQIILRQLSPAKFGKEPADHDLRPPAVAGRYHWPNACQHRNKTGRAVREPVPGYRREQ